MKINIYLHLQFTANYSWNITYLLHGAESFLSK